MFCCPYENKYFPEYAEIEGGDTWEKCSRLAAEHGIYLVAGSMPERDEAGNIYNTSYVLTEMVIRSVSTGRCIFLTLM